MIRKATLHDLEAIVAGNATMALETEGIALAPETLQAGVRAVLAGRAPATYYVLEEDGRVLAQLLITHEWSDWRNADVWWIQSLYVWPEQRRRGLFRELYRAVLEEARAAGAAGLRLYVHDSNQRAQATYAALGMHGGRYRVFEARFDEPPGRE